MERKFRLRSGAKKLDVWFVPVFVYHDDNAHHQVKVGPGGTGEDEHNWHAEDDGKVAAHEFGHMLGNPDEYSLPARRPRSPRARPQARGAQAHELGGPHRGEEGQGHGGLRRPVLMGAHYKSTRLHLRYADDIVATFNAKLRLAGEADWVAEPQT